MPLPPQKAARLHSLERQQRRLKQRLTELQRRSERFSWIRLIVFLVGGAVMLAVSNLTKRWPFWLAGLITLVLLSVVISQHRRLKQAIARHQGWLRIKSTHAARLTLDWEQLPAASTQTEPGHPFEVDLDMSGDRSIHQLIDTAASLEGSQRLRAWLLSTQPDLALIQKRQALIQELIPLVIFRDKLTLYARFVSKGQWNGQRLLDWLRSTNRSPDESAVLIILGILSVLNIGLLLLSSITAVSPVLRALCFLTYAGLYISQLRKIQGLFDEAFSLSEALNKLRAVFGYLETYRYGTNRHLQMLCAPLLDPVQRPSVQLRRLSWILAAASVQRNPVLWLPVNAVVPWDLFFAQRLSRSKAALNAFAPGWLDVWYELEALSSLATFAYLNPEYTFPEINPNTQPVLYAQTLGHPLIPADRKVCNDLTINTLGEMLLITGSNMAGKSSFLRALGVNLCLAYAGGVVNAEALRIPLFRVFTCIRVSDSVTDGFSYFYAEVRRLKALLNALQQPNALPLFFLIDEIFRGTNNRERLIGSSAYIRALVDQNGVGILSTHDLELVKLADAVPAIHNYHFREEVIGGQMVFDYKLRSGPSPTTNALKIMEMEGLPVNTLENINER